MVVPLMGLRRAVAGTSGHGHRVLSLTDNMSSPLAFDRGRSGNDDLLCLCRRAAALCIGADVSWVLRHLETWRNPSDEGVSGALAVQVRVNPEPVVSAEPTELVPFRSRRTRAVLELCHGDPWLSVPLRRRGVHVALSCDMNTVLLVPERSSP